MLRLLRLVLLALLTFTSRAGAAPPLALPAPPVALPDVGSGCPGLLPCSTLDVFAFTLRVDSWLAQGQEGQRGTAGGLRGALMLDIAERFELGVSAAFLAWDPLGGADRRLAWNIAGAHARARLWPVRRPPEGEVAKWSLVATYDHLVNPSDTRIGLLPAGGSTGTGQLALERGLGRVSLTVSAGATYDPGRGAAAALLGVGATFDTKRDNPLRAYLQAGGRLGVHGDAGSPSAWLATGIEGIMHSGGLGIRGGVLVAWGGDVASALFMMGVSERFGVGNGGKEHIPHWWQDIYAARIARQERQRLAELAAQEALQQLPQQLAQQLQQQQQGAPGGPYAGVLDQVGHLPPPYAGVLDQLGMLSPPPSFLGRVLDRLGGPPGLTEALGPYLRRRGPLLAGLLSPWEQWEPSGLRLPPYRPGARMGMLRGLLGGEEGPPAPRLPGPQVLRSPAEPPPPPRPPSYRVVPPVRGEAVHVQPPTGQAPQRGEAVHVMPPAPARGANNPKTSGPARRGTQLHADQPGRLPEQLREQMPETQLEFAKPGERGQDVRYVGGKHPSEYPGSTWPPGVNRGDFKPDTAGGKKTFRQDQKHKWPEPTHMIPYDPTTGKLR